MIVNFLYRIVIVVFSIYGGQVYSQHLLSAELVRHNTVEDVQFLMNVFGISQTARNGVEAYKIRYTTLGSDMLPDTASGLMLLPDNITGPLPLLAYQHGTTDGKSSVPSTLQSDYLLGAVFAALGMVVSEADYIGLGDSRGFHPYVHAQTEASAGVDMMLAVVEYLEENQIERDSEIFVTGYSQGGHAAMALHRTLEQDYSDIFPVTASLPMSGPYDISGVMRDLVFSDEEFFFPSYVIYSTLGAKAINDELYDDISEVFKPEFLPAIRAFSESGENLFQMNLQILNILESQFGGSVPKFVFRDSILNVLESDLSHPFNQYLAGNDVYNWIPIAPVRMLYCRHDDQVSYLNSIVADSVMNANGALNVEAIDVSGGQLFDHTDCVQPALNNGIPWILSFLDTTVPTEDVLATDELSIFPNPASSRVLLNSVAMIEHVSLYNIKGEMMFSVSPASQLNSYELDVSSYQRGYFMLRVETDNGWTVRPLIIR